MVVLYVVSGDTFLDMESVFLMLTVDDKALVVTDIMVSLESGKMKTTPKKRQLPITITRRI